MSKERFLTVLVPITDADAESTVYADEAALIAAVPPSVENINKVYKLEDGTYERVWFNPSSGVSGAYEYHAVVDREFPYLGNPLEIYDFTYDATRMGTAPTISAANVMWYAEKDGSGNDITLEGLWKQTCHVSFNGENLYLKQIPTSGKSNEDARYKYNLDFVAERVVLENVYIYDIVSPFITERPISESATFSFYGDITELAKRINASLIRSGLASLTRKYVNYPTGIPDKAVPYLTYEQWNSMLVNPLPLIGVVFDDVAEMVNFRIQVYFPTNGDYNRYLVEFIYENTNGIYDLTGYQCRIGINEKGELTTSEEKLVSFDKNTIYEALQQFHDTFDVQYYITKEKDENGDFTGNTLIMIDDCEHDFADIDPLTGDFVRDDEGIPISTSPFDYGYDNELLSKEKNNTTDKVVTRITGVGSTENIPWYYPNPNPDGWIKPLLTRNGEEISEAIIHYPVDEGSTVADNVRYEKYLKNRIGVPIKKGILAESFVSSSYDNLVGVYSRIPVYSLLLTATYIIRSTKQMPIGAPSTTLELDYNPSLSGCTRMMVQLVGATTENYDTNATYDNPTAFQNWFAQRDGSVILNYPIIGEYYYWLKITYVLPYDSIPLSVHADFSGYLFQSQEISYNGETGTYTDEQGKTHMIQVVDEKAYIGENFYPYDNLVVYAEWFTQIVWSPNQNRYTDFKYVFAAGYSSDGSLSGLVTPLVREKNLNYKDLASGTIYNCTTSEVANVHDGTAQEAFSANPIMGGKEWISTFVNMKLKVYRNDGWYINSKKIELSDYGLTWPSYEQGGAYPTNIFDAIEFQRLKWITPMPNLMPEVFIKTDGERRFYNAHNYWDSANDTLYVGTADMAIGEVQVDDKVRNPIYKEHGTDPDNEHYQFENEYSQQFPHEHIEDFEDVKPTIEGMENILEIEVSEADIEDWSEQYSKYYIKNQEGEFEQASSTYDPEETYYAALRIDVVETLDYDWTDNDEIWESNDYGNTEGEYKHPYFFAKLRPLGFNLFNLALQEDMVISFTTGNCGACNFKIGVDEQTKKNPVQIWKYDVYEGDTLATATKVYDAGSLRRYVDTSNLHYNTDDTEEGYISVNAGWNIQTGGFLVSETPNIYRRYIFSTQDVADGFVGSMKTGNGVFEGDVVTSGYFIDSQQDTSENYVWVALMKDTDTYGTIMPSAIPNYADQNYNVYIRPKSIQDVHIDADPSHGIAESSFEEDQERADKFVILNIAMPQVYLRAAERKLAHELVKYMYENNWQKFNFSLKFSRIFLAQNEDVDSNVNENSVLYVLFNNNIYRQYVKHYTYRMSRGEALPEINIDMNEELTVSRTLLQQWDEGRRRDGRSISSRMSTLLRQMQSNIEHRTVSKTGDTILSGNVVIGDTTVSLIELSENGGGGDVDSISYSEIDEITEN